MRKFYRIPIAKTILCQTSVFCLLVYSTQVNSAFCVCWLASLEVIGNYYSPSGSWRDTIMHQEFGFRPFFVFLKEINSFLVFSEVYSYLRVGESGEHCQKAFYAFIKTGHWLGLQQEFLSWIAMSHRCCIYLNIKNKNSGYLISSENIRGGFSASKVI